MVADFHTSIALRRGRVHEVHGAGAMAFALITTRSAAVLWIREAWRAEGLDPQGLIRFRPPEGLLLARPSDQTDALAVAEEALKDGALPFVVLEVTRPLNLREGRRLQLAAKAGNSLGLCIIPEGMGSNAAETRWRAEPVFDPLGQGMVVEWHLSKNKSGPLGTWRLAWEAQAGRMRVLAQASA
ncbi:hypothetical protein [Thioclava sp. GXIMD2076]|uniref:hypothetical protein n=1 Tax=Thioclava sp. GXIMD2076 TaxID=3131931 RepID=UPI0030D13808